MLDKAGKAPRTRRLNLRASEAEQALADQRRFALDPEQWNAFVAALDRPIQLKPRLRRLFSELSVLEKPQS